MSHSKSITFLFFVILIQMNLFVLVKNVLHNEDLYETVTGKKNPELQTIQAQTKDEVMELLNMILDTISTPTEKTPHISWPEKKSEGDRLEAFVLNLSPEKRQALSQLLSMPMEEDEVVPTSALKREEMEHHLPILSKNMEVHTVPPIQRVNIMELLKSLVLNEPERRTVNTQNTPVAKDPKCIKNLLISGREEEFKNDHSLNESINNFIDDLNAYKLGVYNFA